MGIDLLIVEARDYTSWNESVWAQYWNDHKEYDSMRLGGGYAAASVIEMVFRYAERGIPGSMYPLFSRLSTDAQGWSNSEIAQLGKEVNSIVNVFKKIDITKQLILRFDCPSGVVKVSGCTASECSEFINEFMKEFPGHPCHSLYDINHYFFETLLGAIDNADHCQGSILIWR